MPALVRSMVLFVAVTLTVAPADAQQATGTISGEIVMGTAGVAVPEGLVVELIAVDVDGALSTVEVASEGGGGTSDVGRGSERGGASGEVYSLRRDRQADHGIGANTDVRW